MFFAFPSDHLQDDESFMLYDSALDIFLFSASICIAYSPDKKMVPVVFMSKL